MAISDLKMKDSDFTGKQVTDLSDNPSEDGVSATDLKEMFVAPSKRVVLPAFNALIELLAGSEGAANIGATQISGLSGYTVQDILEAIKALLDTMKPAEDADREIAQKFDKKEAQALVKTIDFNESNGIFTITKYDGTVQTIDTAIEKVALNVRLEGQQFVLTLVDGTEQRVDLSAFLTQTEVKSSNTITLTITNGVISAQLVAGSIKKEHLSDELTEYIEGKEGMAAESAAEAGVQAKNAWLSAFDAEESKIAAKASEVNAKNSEQAAKESEGNAKASENSAAESAEQAKKAAEEAASEVEKALQEAKESGAFDGKDGYTPVKGKDYWTPEEVAEINNVINNADNAVDSANTATNNANAAAEEARNAINAIDSISNLPHGGSKEWLDSNGDKTQLYQIDGSVWGYIDSEGWNKTDRKFIVVSSESAMTNEGGTQYLLRSGDEGTVYEYHEASGDIGVPVYDSLPETANEGDVVAVGGRKYRATLTSKEVPDYTNLAVTLHEGKRYNSGGALVEQIDAIACEDFIPFSKDTVVRVSGLGELNKYNFIVYTDTIDSTMYGTVKPAATNNYMTYTYDATTDTATLTSLGFSTVQYIRAVGILTGSISDVIITVNEEITTKTETTVNWTDIGIYTPPVEAGWSATDEKYDVIDSISTTASNGDSAVYSADGHVYTFIVGEGWMAMSKYSPTNLTVDKVLSETSGNAVANKAVTSAINELNATTKANTDKILTLQNKVETQGGSSSGTATGIPSYWETHIAEKTEIVKALQEAGGKDCISFTWGSDTHIPDNDNGRTTDLGKLMAKMLANCSIPFAFLTGDVNTRASYAELSGLLNAIAQIAEHLFPLWGEDELVIALGNHDGCWGDSSGYYKKQFTPEKMWNVFFRGQSLDFRRVFSDDGLYFYIDNITQKTRFIILNSQFGGEYAEDSNGYAVNNRFSTSCYGQEQLDWFANVALDTDYDVLLYAHVPPNITYTVDKEQFIGIVNAYNDRTTYSGSYKGVDGWTSNNVSVDFTSAKGEIIAMFAGHVHVDKVDTTTMACPILTIISAGASVNEHNLEEGQVAPTRKFGTDTETSFDVVTINKRTRTIYCTRVGAGEDREVSY